MSKMQSLTLALVIAGCAHARTADQYRADTDKVLAAKTDDLKACYDKVLAMAPTAQGSVTVTFAVEEKTGRITNPMVDAAKTTAPDAVQACVLGVLPALVISPGDGKRGQATWTWQFAAPKAS